MGFALLAAVAAAYGPTFRAGFIWNDSDYVTAPPLRSLEGLGKIWTQLGVTEQYYPALHTAFWLQHKLWGDAALGYHLATLAFHALAALLLWRVLLHLGVRGAWLGAMLFGLHPVCVESVAWIAEQKNTLSLLLYLAAALVYLRHRGNPSASRYAAATALFIVALLTKSVTATLPAALLVAFWWQQGRLSWGDVRPLLPWFAAGIAFGLFSAWVEHSIVGAKGDQFDVTWAGRFALAGRIVWFYLAKLAWPANLIFIYPRWTVDPTQATAWAYSLAALLLLGCAWLYRTRSRAPLAALLFFLGSLFPVMGFMNVYGFKFSYVADHWQYLPCIGPLALAGASFSRLVGACRPAVRPVLHGGCGAVLLACAVMTWRLCQPYRDIETFYRTTLAGNPGSWMSHTNLALLLLDSGRQGEALEHLEAAFRLRPASAEVANNLGVAERKIGRPVVAMDWFRTALRLRPEYPEAAYNLGISLLAAGDAAQAKREFERAIAARPTYAAARNQLGSLLLGERDLAGAKAQFEASLKAEPEFSDAEHNLALVMVALDRRPEAIRLLEEALKHEGSRQESRWMLAVLLVTEKRPGEAIRHLRDLIAAQPDHADAHLLLAQLLRETGDLSGSARQAEEGQRLKRGQSQAPAPRKRS